MIIVRRCGMIEKKYKAGKLGRPVVEQMLPRARNPSGGTAFQA